MNSDARPVHLRIIRFAFAIGGTVGILFLAWRYLSWDVLADSFSHLHLLPLVASFLFYLAVNAVRGARFLLVGADITFIDAFSMAAVHTALLRVMPFRSGELAYGIMLKRMGKGGLGQGVATILVLRLLDFAVIMVLAVLSVGSYFIFAKNGWTVLLVVLVAAAMIVAFFAAGPIIRGVERLFGKRELMRGNAVLVRAIRAVADTVKLSFRRRVALLLATIALWMLVLGWFYFLMVGTGMSIGVVDGLSAGMLGVVGSMLPLSIVGSFGPLEGGFAIGFCAVGFSAASAAASSIVLSTFTFCHSWLIAIPGWFWVLSRSRSKPRAPKWEGGAGTA